MKTITMEMKRYNGTTFTVTCPKTVIEQVQGWNHHEANDGIHVTNEFKSALRTLATINENGYVPVHVPRTVLEYPTYQAMLDDLDNQPKDAMIMVLDATGDITVDHGWAMYLVHKDAYGTIQYKVSDSAMLDMSISLATIKGFNQTSETIDTMVTQSHTHDNVNTLATIIDGRFVDKNSIQQVKTCEDSELTTLDASVDTMIFSKTI